VGDSDPYAALRVILRILWVVAAFPVVAVLWGLDHVHAPWWFAAGCISAYLGVGGLVFGREAKPRSQRGLTANPKPPAS
jgi:hypothetical protein